MTLRCASCDHENRADRRFCGACGAVLQQACTSCGFLNAETDRFCGGCGSSLSATGRRSWTRGSRTRGARSVGRPSLHAAPPPMPKRRQDAAASQAALEILELPLQPPALAVGAEDFLPPFPPRVTSLPGRENLGGADLESLFDF